MNPGWELQCIGCGERVRELPADCRCAGCGDLLEARLRAVEAPAEGWTERWRQRRLSKLAGDQSGVWRFRELLPELGEGVTLREGNTPLYTMPRSGAELGLNRLLAKHQGMNPTGSFKDTGMAVAMTAARQSGKRWAACASTGNTAASMAAYAARAGLRSLVLLPEGKITAPKLAQALDYGAITCQLPASFDRCLELVGELAQRMPLYVVNSINPFRIEGQKTVAFEIAEDLGWEAPAHVIVPGGNLGNASALGQGFRELTELGLVQGMPKITIVQAEGANPLARYWNGARGERLEAVKAETLATAIRIGNPASWKKAARTLSEGGGWCLEVSESEIADAKADIGSEGIGCEPASATTLAGAKKLAAQRRLGRQETVVLVLTGHTLKDGDYTVDYHQDRLPGVRGRRRRPPLKVEATAAAVEAALRRVEAE